MPSLTRLEASRHPALEGSQGGEGGEHAPSRLAFEGSLDEDEAEARRKAPVEAAGLDLEHGGAGSAAVEAEDSWEVGCVGVVGGGEV